jgi:type I restriction enzyme S subunit
MILPGGELLVEFDELVGSLYRKVSLNQRESLALATKRDEILPKLVSGEMPVGEVLL